MGFFLAGSGSRPLGTGWRSRGAPVRLAPPEQKTQTNDDENDRPVCVNDIADTRKSKVIGKEKNSEGNENNSSNIRMTVL